MLRFAETGIVSLIKYNSHPLEQMNESQGVSRGVNAPKQVGGGRGESTSPACGASRCTAQAGHVGLCYVTLEGREVGLLHIGADLAGLDCAEHKDGPSGLTRPGF